MKNKKGQVFEQFGNLAIGIAVFSILLVVAFLIMSQGKLQAVSLIDATTYVNETQTAVTFEEFVKYPKCVTTEGMGVTELYPDVINWSTIGLTNAVVSLNGINFSNKTGEFNSTTFNVTYSCKQPDEAYNSTETLQNATSQVPTWVPIIVVTFIGAILLGLVALLKRREL